MKKFAVWVHDGYGLRVHRTFTNLEESAAYFEAAKKANQKRGVRIPHATAHLQPEFREKERQLLTKENDINSEFMYVDFDYSPAIVTSKFEVQFISEIYIQE